MLKSPTTATADFREISSYRRILLNSGMGLLSALVAGTLCGVGWRIDSWSFLGIMGLGIFLDWQASCKKLISCLLHALATGYLGFSIANSWMASTVKILNPVSEDSVFYIAHGINLIHCGVFVAFAFCWWLARKKLYGGYVAAPLIWLILESVYPSLFPIRIGTLVANCTPLIQSASVFGALVVSLQVFLIAGLIPLSLMWLRRVQPIKKSTAKFGIIAILLITTANCFYGWQRSNSIRSSEDSFSGDFLNVGLIQGTTDYATSHLEFGKRSRTLVENGAELIVWPECSFGKYQRNLVDFSSDLEVATKSFGIGHRFRPLSDPQCHLLGGGYSWEGKDDKGRLTSRYVTAFMLDDEEQLLGRHDKVELMAGGEYIPLESWIPSIRDWLGRTIDEDHAEGTPLSRGSNIQPIGKVKEVSIGAILCCEDMSAEISRKMICEGADVIVCLTNGGAFESEVAINQHFNLGRFRSVENNCYFIRCSSTGVSCLLRPDGSVVKSLPSFTEIDTQVEIPIESRPRSLFSQTGNLLTPASCVVIACLFLMNIGRGKENRRLGS